MSNWKIIRIFRGMQNGWHEHRRGKHRHGDASATPASPTYEPLQIKYFKRLAPNGANGQVLTHSNHLGTHLDGEIHFYTPGQDIAQLSMDYLVHEAAVVDLSDVCGDYDVYTSKMVGFFPWRFVDGESCIGRAVAMVDDDRYEKLMAKKAGLPKTKFGDAFDPRHVQQIETLTKNSLA